MNEFFEQNPIFTTSQAGKAGIDKKFIKGCKEIVDLGTFDVRTDQKGQKRGVRREHVYTYNPELAQMAREVSKLSKKSNVPQEDIEQAVAEVNQKAQEILWNAKGETNGDQNKNVDE